MLVKQAVEFGKISTGNTKIPGTTYAVDAFACKTGSKLAKIAGTPCSVCYARRLQKLRPSVDQGWKLNLKRWEQSNPKDWIAAMIFQIERYNVDGFHRWFDSGDLQSVTMLDAIVEVAKATPNVQHWLPTQERKIVKDFGKDFPANLIVRTSASKFNGPMPSGSKHGSQVFTKGNDPLGLECKARSRGNSCGDCRACWDRSIDLISYPKH
tara:strand:- start:1630 stop:2259 length:630 start_codon:yes stop_codon:yes gene_type:complete